MENYLYISSNKPSILFVNMSVNTMHENEYLIVKTDENFLCLQCQAIADDCILPICVLIDFFNINFLQNNNIKITKLSPQHYKIYFNFQKCITYRDKALLFETILDNCTLSFWDSTMQYVIIQNADSIQTIIINRYVNQPKIIKFGKLYALTGKTENLDFICVFDNCGNIIFEEAQDLIEIGQDNISVLQKINDIANHGYVSKYKLVDGIINLVEQYSVYLDEKPHYATNNHIVGLAFLEALNIGNLALARYYLSDELSSSLSDKQLTDFFGNYLEFEPNFLEDADNCLLLTYANNIIKKFKMPTNNFGKIVDIIID